MSNAPVVFVTGGSRGIGRAIVERFAAGGWQVAACATTEAGATACSADLGLVCDVSDAGAVAASVARVVERFARLDAVINNAGIAGENSLDPSADDDFWHRVIDVNLNGTYYVCKHATPHLPDGTGRIINIASILALRGVPDQTAYCAAKHGVLGLTRALAHRLAPRGITVNAICPGWTRSDMAQQLWDEIGIDEEKAARTIPIGRVTEPHEVAELAFYLASAPAGSVTGQALTIDGGSLA